MFHVKPAADRARRGPHWPEMFHVKPCQRPRPAGSGDPDSLEKLSGPQPPLMEPVETRPHRRCFPWNTRNRANFVTPRWRPDAWTRSTAELTLAEPVGSAPANGVSRETPLVDRACRNHGDSRRLDQVDNRGGADRACRDPSSVRRVSRETRLVDRACGDSGGSGSRHAGRPAAPDDRARRDRPAAACVSRETRPPERTYDTTGAPRRLDELDDRVRADRACRDAPLPAPCFT